MPRSKKTRALLAYLALTGRPHSRQQLCALFWEVPDDPRGALRWSLSKLRSVVDEADATRIVADRDTIAFERQGAAIDLLDIRARFADLSRLDNEMLKQSAELFRGEPLEGLDLPECHEYQLWCLAQRSEAQALQARIARTLVERLAAVPEEALPYARSLALIESDREEHWAGLGHLLAAAGRRREAEAQCELGLRVLQSVGAPARGPLLKVIRNLRP